MAADATGFGAAELRMTRDLIVRPDVVLREQGRPGSPYPKPLRYYLTLNGLYLVVIALVGGFENAFSSYWTAFPEVMGRLVDVSGKSRDSFSADLDQWYSLTAVPIIALVSYPMLSWLLGRWTGARTVPGQTFTFLSAWTLMGMIPGLISLLVPSLSGLSALFILPILVMLILRMGRGVWWTTAGQFVVRLLQAAAVMIALQIVVAPIAIGIALAGAIWAP